MTDGFNTWPATGPSPHPQVHPPPGYPPQPHAQQSHPPPPFPPQPYPPQPYSAQAGALIKPPSGLFPGMPPRPVYREPHPVRVGPLLAGLGAGVLWFALFGSLGRDLISYVWWSIVASVTAWLVALVLGRLGDRGVAAGVALASGLGLSVALGFVGARWIGTQDWPLW